MNRRFSASVWQEDEMFIAQCRELDVVSQGYTEQDALEMLTDAIRLYLSEPDAGTIPDVTIHEIEIDAA